MRAHDRAHLAELFDKENTTDGVIGVSLLDPVAAPLRMVERGPIVDGHKHRAGAAVEYFAGLDVSLEETAIFIIDDAGLIVREAGTAVGLEACSPTLAASGTDRSGYCGNCIETRQAKAAIGAMPNKTDRNDARGIAQIMRTRRQVSQSRPPGLRSSLIRAEVIIPRSPTSTTRLRPSAA